MSPDEDGKPVQRHSGRALFEGGGDDFDRGHQGGDFRQTDHLGPKIDPLAGREFGPGERHVAEPAGVNADVEEEAAEQRNAAEEINIIAERVQARKSHVTRANHQRNEVKAHRLPDRDCEQEHHRRAVHRKKLVVEVGPEHVIVGAGELKPHEHRQNAGEREKHHRRDDRAHGDVLVIGRREPAQNARCAGPCAAERVVLGFLDFRGKPAHGLIMTPIRGHLRISK